MSMKYVILGSTPRSIQLIEHLRLQDKDCEITLLTVRYYVADTEELFELFQPDTQRSSDTFKVSSVWCKEYKVNHIESFKINRISPKRKLVVLEDKTQLAYSILIVEDVRDVAWPEIKGVKKQGVYSLSHADHVVMMRQNLPMVSHAIIHASDWQGLVYAGLIKPFVMDVAVVVSDELLLDEPSFSRSERTFRQEFEESGIQYLQDTALVEVIGESEVKAVRLDTGKVLACDLLGISNLKSQLKLFDAEVFAQDEGFLVSLNGQTSVDTVFAFGCVVHNAHELLFANVLNTLCKPESSTVSAAQ